MIFWIYTGVGCVKAIMVLCLSRQCERADKEEATIHGSSIDEREPLLNGHDTPPPPPPQQNSSLKRFRLNFFTSISKPSRWILFKLCSLFILDSLGSGMVPFSLINFYMERKFRLSKGKLGGIMSGTWFISTVGNVFASSLAKRLGLIQAMVATHLPSSIFLALLPISSGLPLTICLLVGRSVLNSMDQAPRSAFLSLVVLPEERTAVMGIVNILKTLSQSGGPWITGILAGHDRFWVAFVAAGSIKAAYDLALLIFFAGRVHEHESPEHVAGSSEAPNGHAVDAPSDVNSDESDSSTVPGHASLGR
jgi:predicted MFS family arabinose efflux permease